MPLLTVVKHTVATMLVAVHTSYIIHHTSYIIHHTSYIIHHTPVQIVPLLHSSIIKCANELTNLMCVCMYVYVCIYMYVCTYACVCTYARVCVHVNKVSRSTHTHTHTSSERTHIYTNLRYSPG